MECAKKQQCIVKMQSDEHHTHQRLVAIISQVLTCKCWLDAHIPLTYYFDLKNNFSSLYMQFNQSGFRDAWGSFSAWHVLSSFPDRSPWLGEMLSDTSRKVWDLFLNEKKPLTVLTKKKGKIATLVVLFSFLQIYPQVCCLCCLSALSGNLSLSFSRLSVSLILCK